MTARHRPAPRSRFRRLVPSIFSALLVSCPGGFELPCEDASACCPAGTHHVRFYSDAGLPYGRCDPDDAGVRPDAAE